MPSTPTALRGTKLEGRLILEVPPQINPVPKSILDAAREHKVTIRDHTGRVYK